MVATAPSSWASTSASWTRRWSPSPARWPACASSGAGRAGAAAAGPCCGRPGRARPVLLRDPERLLVRPSRRRSSTTHNAQILGAHLLAAAYERPLGPDDDADFGERLAGGPNGARRPGELRRAGRRQLSSPRPDSPPRRSPAHRPRPSSMAIVDRPHRASCSARSSASASSAPSIRAPCTCTWALLRGASGSTSTTPRRSSTASTATGTRRPKTDTDVLPAGPAGTRRGRRELSFGEVEVTEQVIAFQRRDLTTSPSTSSRSSCPSRASPPRRSGSTLPPPSGCAPPRTARPRRRWRSARCTRPSTPRSPCCR